MKIDGKIKGRALRPHGFTHRNDHDPEEEGNPKYDHSLLTCSYEYFIKHYLPQWYTEEEIESMLYGVAQLNHNPNQIKHMDLPS